MLPPNLLTAPHKTDNGQTSLHECPQLVWPPLTDGLSGLGSSVYSQKGKNEVLDEGRNPGVLPTLLGLRGAPQTHLASLFPGSPPYKPLDTDPSCPSKSPGKPLPSAPHFLWCLS